MSTWLQVDFAKVRYDDQPGLPVTEIFAAPLNRLTVLNMPAGVDVHEFSQHACQLYEERCKAVADHVLEANIASLDALDVCPSLRTPPAEL